ncbi:REP-associated tyrosine transposase [Idiomarina seosinensis]|uniref:Transposase n=1 Tax=Idiomarina seosinensis TaxID=281739 RepID=A0A432ZGQ9_9GAMM|nr:transposase [Idiomarina seosinensis]RUO77109.1 transposase [Idiomarina seosinensis]
MKKWKLRKFYPPDLYFVTINTYQREPLLLEEHTLKAFRHALAKTKYRYPFENHAWVIMPDHMHFVIRTKHIELGRFIGRLKSEMTRQLPELSAKNYCLNDKFKWRRRREMGQLWHNGFFEHRIRENADYERCVKYCLYNPVKHGYAPTAWDWPYSTLREFIKQGKYPLEWKYLQSQWE